MILSILLLLGQYTPAGAVFPVASPGCGAFTHARTITIPAQSSLSADVTNHAVVVRTPVATVNTSGTSVTATAGDAFASWMVGQSIAINGTQYTVSAVGSSTTMTLSTTAGTQTGVAFNGFPYLATVANGGTVQNASGYDVGFYTDNTCTTKLAWETELYTNTGLADYWVKLPTVSKTSATTFVMAYDNAAISTDQSNTAGTWDANFKGIYHLPNGTTLSAVDSSATQNGTITAATATTGSVDGAGAFVANTQYIDIGQAATHYTVLTVEGWAYDASLFSASATLISKGYDGNTEWQMVTGGGTSTAGISFFTWNGGFHGVTAGGSTTRPMTVGVWNYVVGRYDGTNWSVYINGALDQSVADIGPISTTAKMTIAAVSTPGYSQGWDGRLDEMRISNIVRSPDYIALRYANQNSPSTFYSLGSQF